MPTVKALGIDTVHFGVITVFNLLIGLVTPPYGLTMFLLCRIANISLQEFWRYQWPIFLTMLFALAYARCSRRSRPGCRTWSCPRSKRASTDSLRLGPAHEYALDQFLSAFGPPNYLYGRLC